MKADDILSAMIKKEQRENVYLGHDDLILVGNQLIFDTITEGDELMILDNDFLD